LPFATYYAAKPKPLQIEFGLSVDLFSLSLSLH